MSASPRSPDSTYTTAWFAVACVFGMDYLSTLAYLPSIAVKIAGVLAPIVLMIVALVTLGLALPLYSYIAGRSANGHGTLGLLEKVIPGWFGKLLVVILLGFLATDLVFTRTFSAADAAEHVIRSPFLPWQQALDDLSGRASQVEGGLPDQISSLTAKTNKRQLVVALGLLIAGTAFGWCFRKGVNRTLTRIAIVVLVIYLTMTAIVIGSCAIYLVQHPSLIDQWWQTVVDGRWNAEPRTVSLFAIIIAAMLLFPQLALGLSGYELTLAATSLIKSKDESGHFVNRIRRTRWILVTLAIVMCLFMLLSGFAVTILVPPEAMATDGKAENRTLAYLAHGGELNHGIVPTHVSSFFGTPFGAIYDLITVIVLTIAGVIVLIGTRNLIPPYLYRLGMDWTWSNRLGLMMYLFTAIKLIVTAFYRADVEAQKAAYLTGVLALFTGAALTAIADVWQRKIERGRRLLTIWFGIAAIVFALSLIVVVIKQPVALRMAGVFVVAILLSSMFTRFIRTRELRFDGFDFPNEECRLQWWHLQNNNYPMLLPIRPGQDCMIQKEKEIRDSHRLPDDVSIVFLEAHLSDPSDFYHRPEVVIAREDHRVIVRITLCNSVPHAIAAAAIEIAKAGPVPEIHFGWSRENPLTANINFVLFGQGNVPWMVHELIQRSPCDPARKPKVIVG